MTKRIANKYAGKCECGNHVPPGLGFAELSGPGKGKWSVRCSPCVTGNTPTPEPAHTELEERPQFPLTSEQVAAVDLFLQGDSVAIQAGAGTGKTSTLVAIGKATDRMGQFVAFNRAIVADARAKMPRNIACSTMSSLAMQQIGHRYYSHRLDAAKKMRTPSSKYAKLIGVGPFFWRFGQDQHVLQPSRLAGLVHAAIETFCSTTDTEPGAQHIEYVDGIDLPDAAGNRTYVNNDNVKAHLLPYLGKVWADYMDPAGQLPRFTLSHVEKIWQMGVHGAPIIPGQFILFDEAQDATPVYLDVVRQQGKQVVWVGDSQQQIYDWRGAVDAMAGVPAESTTYLTNSFRFGPVIADLANRVLDNIETAELRLVGRGEHEGTTGPVVAPDAVLCRTNAGAIGTVLDMLTLGLTTHLVGGGGEVERFAKAAKQLQTTGATEHPDLCVFKNWAEVQGYVQGDPDGDDLKLMVKLIDDFGVDAVLSAVGNTCEEQDADVVVSTAHKSKGREWDVVQLGPDFSEARTADADYRLLYVSVTRARQHLDYSHCPAMLAVMGENLPGEER